MLLGNSPPVKRRTPDGPSQKLNSAAVVVEGSGVPRGAWSWGGPPDTC